jgi:hypothetical protein
MYALDILKHIEVTPADYDEVYRLFGPPGNLDRNCDDDLALAMAIIRRRGPRHNLLVSIEPADHAAFLTHFDYSAPIA